MLLELEVRRPGHPPVSRCFARLPVTIGRSEDCALVISLPFVSRFHTVLDRGPGGQLVVSDAGSRYGIFVGDRRVGQDERVALPDTADFRLEDVTIRARWLVTRPKQSDADSPSSLRTDVNLPFGVSPTDDPLRIDGKPPPSPARSEADALRMFRALEALDDVGFVRTGRGV